MQRRVLLADSDIARYNQSREQLEAKGYRVFGVHGVSDPLSQGSDWPPDAIVVAADLRNFVDSLPGLFDHTPIIGLVGQWTERLEQVLRPPAETLYFRAKLAHLPHLIVQEGGKETKLTAIEAELLAYFTLHGDQALHRTQLLQRVWGYHANVASRAVDSTIKRLRKKIEIDPSQPQHLITVFGVGYRLVDYASTAPCKSTTAPAPPSSIKPSLFLGRSQELAAITHAFDSGHHWVSLCGFGGAGKTTLAQFWADNHANPLNLFVDLSQARDKNDIVQVLAQATQIPLAVKSDKLIETLQSTLHARQGGLIILDNCEQVRQATRDLLEVLLDNTSCHWIITSREPLGLPDERVIRVGPLDIDSAVSLFQGRAQQMGLSNSSNEGAIRELVAVLDLNPLAIALASAQLEVMSLEEMKSRLKDNRANFSDADRPDRQQTLSATLQWSWDLLDVDEALCLAQCAVFSGGFTVALAERVLTPSHKPVSQILAGLARRSLIHASSAGRLHLLNITAGFAASQLDNLGQRQATQNRHAVAIEAHCRNVRKRHLYLNWVPCLPMRIEQQNMQAAFERTTDPVLKFDLFLSLDWLFGLYGPSRSRESLLYSLPSVDRLTATQRPQYWLAMAGILKKSDAYEPAYQAALDAKDVSLLKAILTQGLEIHRKHRDELGPWLLRLKDHSDDTLTDRGRLMYYQGVALMVAGKKPEAMEVFRKATTLLPDDQPTLLSLAWYYSGFMAFEAGRLQEAERYFFRCLSKVEETHPDDSIGLQSLLALPALSRGETDLAIRLLNKSIDWLTQQGQIHHLAEDHFVIGVAHQLAGEVDLARSHYRQSLHVSKWVGRPEETKVAYAFLATAEAQAGERQAANKWMALATEYTDISPGAAKIITTCDGLVTFLGRPSAAHRDALTELRAQHPATDARLGWVYQLLDSLTDVNHPIGHHNL